MFTSFMAVTDLIILWDHYHVGLQTLLFTYWMVVSRTIDEAGGAAVLGRQ